MKQIEMMNLFIECSKKFFPDINETELEWQFRVNACDLDKNGPCCSDGTLLRIFKAATNNKIDENELYRTIEQICQLYCYEIQGNK